MECLVSPYTYIYDGRFTNRKHRIVPFAFPLQSDSFFDLHEISMYSNFAFAVRIDGLMIQPLASDATPFPMMPAASFKPGSMLSGVAFLDEGADVGRKRPTFQLVLRGIKNWDWDVVANPRPVNVERSESDAKRDGR
jgi:hypothetical protein